MKSAIEREKRLKEWKRKWKPELIESSNPNWQDLYNTIVYTSKGHKLRFFTGHEHQ
jgi:hypothetical protein